MSVRCDGERREEILRCSVPPRSNAHERRPTNARDFVLGVCGCERLWTSESIIEDAVARIKEQVGDDEVILGLSGGVDSSVVAMLVHRAIGDKLTCVFVDNGLLRLNEGQQVMDMFGDKFGLNIIKVDAEDRFLKALEASRIQKRSVRQSVTYS